MATKPQSLGTRIYWWTLLVLRCMLTHPMRLERIALVFIRFRSVRHQTLVADSEVAVTRLLYKGIFPYSV